jgi:hypothetical protein
LCFIKATREIFSELDEIKAKIPIFPEASWIPKQRRRGARGVGGMTPGRVKRLERHEESG